MYMACEIISVLSWLSFRTATEWDSLPCWICPEWVQPVNVLRYYSYGYITLLGKGEIILVG